MDPFFEKLALKRQQSSRNESTEINPSFEEANKIVDLFIKQIKQEERIGNKTGTTSIRWMGSTPELEQLVRERVGKITIIPPGSGLRELCTTYVIRW